ncbi:MAG TPA: gliding motility-associated C-terminal domain-containing protein, partial [Bacteroidales bacterium]|nr:gliding motility-associated C-terminal domain-containing protein [Bacteroidales bacterium]
TTTYTVMVTDANGCFDFDVTTITVLAPLYAHAGADRIVCDGQSVTLGDSPAASGGSGLGYTYLWSPATGLNDPTLPNPTLVATQNQTYTLRVTDIQGCFAEDQITITVNPPVVVDAGNDIDLCIGNNVVIGPAAYIPNPLRAYLWTSSPPDPSISDPTIPNPTVSPLVTTVYTLTVTDLVTGCSNQDTKTVAVHTAPNVVTIPDSNICFGQRINIGDPLDPPGLTYTWWSSPLGFTSNLANPEVMPIVNTTYFVRVRNAYGCEATGQVTVTVSPLPVAIVANDTVFCSVGQVVPVAIGGPSIPTYTYSWTSDPPGFISNLANPTVTFSGTTPIVYHLTVTNQFNCSARDSVRISLSDLELIVSNPVVCPETSSVNIGNYVTLIGGAGPYFIQWFDQANNLLGTGQSFTAQQPFLPLYQIRVLDSNQCIVAEDVTIQFFPTPLVDLVTHPPGRIYVGQSITVTVLPSGLVNYDFFVSDSLVQSGISNSISSREFMHGQRVSVLVTTLDGCIISSDTITLSINPLPNAFTPDGDGINDFFGEGLHLTIFNRWGQLLYEGTHGWDGTHNGRNVSPGTYFYIWRADGENDSVNVYRGSVTVIRNRN